MKKTIKLFLFAGLALLALSCQKTDNFSGREIRFSASANPSTKTAYGDYEGTTQSLGDFQLDPTHQAINWVEGDQIRIWSDQAVKRYTEANPVHYADYNLVDINGNKANLENPIGANDLPINGLTYVEGVESYDFEAYYPASGITIDAENNNERSYIIPGAQTAKSVESEGLVIETETSSGTYRLPFDILTPDMDKAFMVAQAPNCPWKPYGNHDKSINLQFYPGFTAFEIYIISTEESIKAGEGVRSVALSSVKLIPGPDPDATTTSNASVSGGLAGKVHPVFNNGNTTFECTDTGELVYTFPENTVVWSNHGLIFTVFALPKTINGLTLEFHLTDGQIRTVSLTQITTNGGSGGASDVAPEITESPITFAACKKHRLYVLAVPHRFRIFTTEQQLLVAAHEESEESIVL